MRRGREMRSLRWRDTCREKGRAETSMGGIEAALRRERGLQRGDMPSLITTRSFGQSGPSSVVDCIFSSPSSFGLSLLARQTSGELLDATPP
jgi:hypothetical protein